MVPDGLENKIEDSKGVKGTDDAIKKLLERGPEEENKTSQQYNRVTSSKKKKKGLFSPRYLVLYAISPFIGAGISYCIDNYLFSEKKEKVKSENYKKYEAPPPINTVKNNQ